MDKILIITPHTSTGGLPQYLLKKIESFLDDYEFYVVEWENITGGSFVVQRNKIENKLKDRFYTLEDNKEDIFKFIDKINPDVIHFEEIPETFINENILDVLYKNNRNYKIVITTHSSFTEPENIKYLADKIILPSKWLLKKFNNHFKGEIPCELWEYPFEFVEYDKEEYKKLLSFDVDYKHVLHVGLFTPGKNQKEIFELAKKCLGSKIIFHFVGNQAMNFYDYWQPLMNDKPSNCVWHGECENVGDFYKASDAFYFPSTHELNPLVLKEAVSHGLHLFIKPLETYEDTYDKFCTYLGDDVDNNKKLLFDFLKVEQPKIQIIHLLTESQDERQDKSIQYISKLENENITYTKHINNLYDDIPPKDFCSRPDQVGEKASSLDNGYGVLTGRHYGCFLAHINAIKAIDCDNFDYTLIFESDANIETSVDEFIDIIYRSVDILSKNEDVNFVSFANNTSQVKHQVDEYFSLTSYNQDLAHCYLIPNKDKEWYLDRISDTPWDGYDIWLNDIFHTHKDKKRLTTNKIYSNQIEGMSLIDRINKWGNGVYDYIEIGTSDFDTLIEILPENYRGISIEPIKEYLDKLPTLLNNKKINAAISNTDGELTVYFVSPSNIEKYDMPQWIKGCNSINTPHPSTKKYLQDNSLEHLYEEHKIETLSFRSLVEKYEIKDIKLLKIDTEGHDFVIIRDMLKTNIRPEKLIFEANSLYHNDEILLIIKELKDYGYVLVHRDSQNVIMRFSEIDKYIPEELPILIFSTGRRLEYFTKTIQHLFNQDPNFNEKFKKVWVFDDRSSTEDRFHINKLMSSYFGDNYNMVEFNSNEKFYFVEKFNFIKKVITPKDIVLLLEDDWECHTELNLNYHIYNLKNSNWTQIAFADPFDIQDNELQKKYIIDNFYWKNPYPNHFKHPYKWDGDMCYWSSGSINNWTNNPSLIKGEVFFKHNFILDKNFEWDFSQKLNGNQVFTQEAIFRHFGVNSLINQY